jgi:hypothetical protein
MGVKTDADKELDAAQNYIQMAIECLSKIEVERVWGYNKWKGSYKKKIRGCLISLLDVRDELGD